ncbi:hypothetical protein P8S54_00540 [Thiomicrospira sp. R3]|uniref:hypothetical protein n=1 Tax=Thiomicrospira sp. R3 TaxID=3035472 RepID=UPI00259AECD3|nr:hypothetical protein [Thiomicrospira sp. R3]WFE68819.1 hypothetical protein P8S54_00540 [Thiomicrospira sp. R3]
MIVQATKRNNEWVIPNIPELHANNQDHILLDIHLADNTQKNQTNTDEYIKQNWKKIVSKSLAQLPVDYEKTDQYLEERANYLMEKYK